MNVHIYLPFILTARAWQHVSWSIYSPHRNAGVPLMQHSEEKKQNRKPYKTLASEYNHFYLSHVAWLVVGFSATADSTSQTFGLNVGIVK